MNLLEAALRRMAADLAKYDRRWALVDGFAVLLISSRGFARGRDLTAALEELERMSGHPANES